MSEPVRRLDTGEELPWDLLEPDAAKVLKLIETVPMHPRIVVGSVLAIAVYIPGLSAGDACLVRVGVQAITEDQHIVAAVIDPAEGLGIEAQSLVIFGARYVCRVDREGWL